MHIRRLQQTGIEIKLDISTIKLRFQRLAWEALKKSINGLITQMQRLQDSVGG